MSHEIRTPMNGVIAAGDLALASENLPTDIHRYLEIINTSAHSLLRVIDDILDCSKIESGKMTLERQPFYLFDVLDRLVEIFISKAQEKHIELLLDIDHTVPSLMVGDALRLQQILTNLVSNAFKFTPKGSVVIGISSEQENDHLVILKFYIRDTGVGIDLERQAHLFEPFQQGDTSTTRKYGGTGLGLTIAGRLVEMMGGEIWLESEPGQGSTFYFTVTLIQRKGWQHEIFMPEIRGLRVLLVDDNPLCLQVVKKMLLPLECQVVTATSGQEALEKIRQNLHTEEKFELVLLDWRMDGMDGLSLAALIRSQGIDNLPIILMSAFGKSQELSQLDAAEIDIFLVKPIRRTDLISALNTLFEENRLRSTAPIGDFYPSAKLSGRKILVVEDNDTNQLVVKTILENSGMMVDIVENGRQAVAAVKNQTYDVVLMDVQMPEMDGYEATKIIRSDPTLTKLPIVAMTANAMLEDKEKCFQVGMNAYISKPISQNKLLQVIRQIVEGISSDEVKQTRSPELVGAADDLLQLSGIDTRESLVRLGISQSMFRHVLASFAEDFADFTIVLQDAWNENDHETVKRLIHKIKGSAGSIGALRLHETASVIDVLCKKGLMPDQAQMSMLEISLAEVLDSIADIAEDSSGKGGSQALRIIEPDQLAQAFTTLAEALDHALLENIGNSFNLVKKCVQGWEIDDLGKLIAVYQYDEAGEKLKEIREKLDT
jgi:CheY-like chemotaxis protein/HPt (histidine-containing phosphotransfer) domain-containing protein